MTVIKYLLFFPLTFAKTKIELTSEFSKYIVVKYNTQHSGGFRGRGGWFPLTLAIFAQRYADCFNDIVGCNCDKESTLLVLYAFSYAFLKGKTSPWNAPKPTFFS